MEENNSIEDKLYTPLGPYHTLIYNKKVLSQAWRKVNSFLRSYTWYTDYLELDYISLNLEKNLNDWSLGIERNSENSVKIDNVIPVPKHNEWEFNDVSENNHSEKSNSKKADFNSWTSKKAKEGILTLRPISDVPIENQIYTMAILICISESIETLQGEIQEDIMDEQNRKFYNYGNRLQSIWVEKNGKRKAVFQTGSSLLYQKYFKNYKLFLKRPYQIAQHYFECLNSNNKIYIISLDIEQFYDNINIKVLMEILNKQLKSYYGETPKTQEFIKHVSKHFNWDYRGNLPNEELIDKIDGLPQGLAASGFFANVYLMDFDKKIGSLIDKKFNYEEETGSYKIKKFDEKEIENNYIIIQDYCRYVDDLRIVVEIGRNEKIDKVKKIVLDVIGNELKSFTKNSNLSLNESKTEIIDFSHASSQSISQVLNSHRHLASGTPTIEDITANIESLKSLFLIAVNSDENNFKNRLSLADIFNYNWDLKNTTIEKFVATEFKKNIRIKDSVIVSGKKSNNKKYNIQRNMITKESEMIARLLIKAWSKQPDMIYLLKCAFDIFPSRSLLKAVTEALELKFTETFPKSLKKERETYVAYFIASYLLSQGFLSIRRKVCNCEEVELPNQHDYLEELVVFAEKIVDLHNNKERQFPYYVLQAVILFLIAMNRGNFNLELEGISNKKLDNYILLKDIVVHGKVGFKGEDPTLILCLALIGHQIILTDEQFLSWFIKYINQIQEIEQEKLVKLLFYENNSLFRKLFSYGYIDRIQNEDLKKTYEKILSEYKSNMNRLNNNQEISLFKIIQSPLNPFKQENALLLLTRELLKENQKSRILEKNSILDVNVKCQEWSNIQNPNYYSMENFFKVSTSNSNDQNNNFVQLPFWLDSDFTDERELITNNEYIEKYKDMYRVGRIIRSCLVGDFDYTATKFSLKSEKHQYYGFKNTAFSRSFGLNNSSKELVDREHPITPWFRDLLFYCLRWPYSRFTLEIDLKYKDVLKLVNDRIEFQKNIFGKMSNLPIYIYPLTMEQLSNKEKIRIAVVQTLMPKSKDFDPKNPLYWSNENRVRHRNHIINICNLIERHVKSQNVNNEDDETIDLIVFPELSIHYDDVDLLRRLSNKLKANIFAGLTFMCNPSDHQKVINRAIWLIRQKYLNGEETIEIYQGKQNVTKAEKSWGISGYRPYQIIVEFILKNNLCWRVAGAICYDSTDLKLAADLRDVSDAFIVSAFNKDIQTFDNMVSALSYHMYQTIILANSGEYGGSTVQAPYSGHSKLITHLHGNNQVGIGIFEIDAHEFKSIEREPEKKQTKTPPAGYNGRSDSDNFETLEGLNENDDFFTD